MFMPCSRERARTLARRFKLSGFGHRPQAAGPIRASVRGGPRPCPGFLGWNLRDHSIHSVEDTNLQILYACLVTHDAKA